MATGGSIIPALQAAALMLDENRAQLDALNVFPVPDGDTGANMYLTMAAAAQAVDSLPPDSSACDVLECAALAALQEGRGNSGVMLSMILRGFSRSAKGRRVLTGADVAAGLTLGAKSAYSAVLNPIEGTILTVARRAAEGASAAAGSGSDVRTVLTAALTEAEFALAETTMLLPELKKAGVVDAGGLGFVFILRAILAMEIEKWKVKNSAKDNSTLTLRPCELTYTCCMDFVLKVVDNTDSLREYLAGAGNSLVIAEDGGLLKVHLHTNVPNEILGALEMYGEVLSFKVDDMREQTLHSI